MGQEINRICVLHTLRRFSSRGVEQIRLLLVRSPPKARYEHRVICQDTGVLPELFRVESWQIHEIGTAPDILSPSWHNRAWKIAKDF